MGPKNKSPTPKTAGVTFGLLLLFAGLFFMSIGVAVYGGRGSLEREGNFGVLELVTPMISIGIALFIVAVAVIILLR